MDLPHYHDLEWRLEVGMGSRALQQQVEPSLILRLHTKDGGITVLNSVYNIHTYVRTYIHHMYVRTYVCTYVRT